MPADVTLEESIAISRDRSGSDSRMPPLRERVYAYLKRLLNDGSIKPGAFLDLNSIGRELGFSRTPLRDALLKLEAEGFVTIHARRGVVVNPLDITAIRNAYQLLGSLEAAAIIEAADTFGAVDAERMLALNDEMKDTLGRNAFDEYYAANMAFHDVYISMSANAELKRLTRIFKDRLYDFPKREGHLGEWELESLREHENLAHMLASGDFAAAAAYARDVHWSFNIQERYIMRYYFAREAALGPLL